MDSHQKYWRVTQVLLVLACICIILVFFKWASSIIAPFLIALAITIILNPIVDFFRSLHVPRLASILSTFILALLPIGILASYVGQEFTNFMGHMDGFEEKFSGWAQGISSWLTAHNITAPHKDWGSMLADSNIMNLLRNLLLEAGAQLSNYVMVFFVMIFMLLESDALHDKLKQLSRKHMKGTVNLLAVKEKVTQYFMIKVLTSLITAIAIFIVIWAYGVSYGLLFASITFFLNFIPIVGSIISAIPPVLLALINNSPETAISLIVWFLVLESIIGNVIEPKLMGSSLGLSSLTVLLSMTFWGFIFGPTGIILSTPLTICLVYFFSAFEQTQWVALMLGDEQRELS